MDELRWQRRNRARPHVWYVCVCLFLYTFADHTSFKRYNTRIKDIHLNEHNFLTFLPKEVNMKKKGGKVSSTKTNLKEENILNSGT